MPDDQLFHLNIPPKLARIVSSLFPSMKTLHYQGVVYDQYSIDEICQQRPGAQWLTHPLPHEIGRANYPTPWWPSNNSTSKITPQSLIISSRTKTGLAFINDIYVISDESFVDRHNHLKFVFKRHHIPIESILWQFKWNRTTCNSRENHEYVRKRLNMKPGNYANVCLLFLK